MMMAASLMPINGWRSIRPRSNDSGAVRQLTAAPPPSAGGWGRCIYSRAPYGASAKRPRTHRARDARLNAPNVVVIRVTSATFDAGAVTGRIDFTSQFPDTRLHYGYRQRLH